MIVLEIFFRLSGVMMCEIKRVLKTRQFSVLVSANNDVARHLWSHPD